MGIYSSNVIRESYSVTDFASQIEPDESYNAVTGCAMAFLESQQNDLALFNATIANDFQEVSALQEGYEVINESVASVFEKIKEILKKLIAKIKGIFQSFLAKLRGTFSSSKDLYDKYEKQINKYYNWKDFKVKKFRKKKVNGEIGAAIEALATYKVGTADYKFALGDAATMKIAEIDLLKDDLDNDDIMEKLVKNRLSTDINKSVDSDLGNLNEEIMDYLFEDEDTEDEWKTSDIINGIVGSVLKDTKLENNIKKAADNLVKSINKMADAVDKEALAVNKALGSKEKTYKAGTTIGLAAKADGDHNKRSVSKNTSSLSDIDNKYRATEETDSSGNKTAASKSVNYASNYKHLENKGDLEVLSFVAGNMQKVVGQEQELATKLSSGVLSASKFLIAQARRVWSSAAAYSSTEHKNEGYEFYTAFGEASAYDFMSDMEALD